MTLETILSAFEEALELERELGTRTVEIDRALLRSSPAPMAEPARGASDSREAGRASGPSVSSVSSGSSGSSVSSGSSGASGSSEAGSPGTASESSAAGARADFAFLLEGEPEGPVAELLPKMSEAIGYGPNGVKINDPSARVLIVLGSEALAKWLPGVKARPGQWVQREGVPALITASPTKTYRFFGHDPAKIRALKLRLWADLNAALARLGKTPPGRA